MKAYLDIVGGISGDMMLGAMVDAGLSVTALQNELALLNIKGWSLDVEPALRGAVPATLATVKIDPDSPSGLNWADFRGYATNSKLPEADKVVMQTVFDILEQAEAAAHSHEGKTSSSLKLHELGSLDTIIDVAGTVAGLRMLGVEKVFASPLPIAVGWARTEHGSMPSTALATQAIIQAHGMPMRSEAQPPEGESITPTGTALLAAIADFTPQILSPKRMGHGAGSKNNAAGPPNIISLWLCESTDTDTQEKGKGHLSRGIILLETNIDDSSGETIGHTISRLVSECALDAWTTPIYMKKNRPAALLSVLVECKNEEKALEIIMQETPTLGVRRRPVERYEAERCTVSVKTDFGEIDLKLKHWRGNMTHVAPEYESCREASERTGASIAEIMRSSVQSFYSGQKKQGR